MSNPTYNLSVFDIHTSIDDPNANLKSDQNYYVNPYSTKDNKKYTIIRYNKDLLFSRNEPNYGLLRSIVFSGKNVVSFSPPKSVSPEIFINKYPAKTNEIIAEEFVEGTMINVFYDNTFSEWQITTRNTVGAEVSFYKGTKPTKTFKEMFDEACLDNNLYINTLNPLFCYSFVLQHPENRIVIPFKKPQLYLVAVYKISQSTDLRQIFVEEQNLQAVKEGGMWSLTSIKFPEIYDFENYSDLIKRFASPNTPYYIMGVVVKNVETGERTKFRNTIYEEVRHLKGNQPKLQYQYLCLRHSGKLPEFLKYFPENKSQMSEFRNQVHMFTNTLHKNYIACYVNKEKPLKEFADQYRTHMFKLHEIFLSELREQKLFVTSKIVINYVNQLPPTLLMHSLNYNFKKKFIDTIKADSVI